MQRMVLEGQNTTAHLSVFPAISTNDHYRVFYIELPRWHVSATVSVHSQNLEITGSSPIKKEGSFMLLCRTSSQAPLTPDSSLAKIYPRLNRQTFQKSSQ